MNLGFGNLASASSSSSAVMAVSTKEEMRRGGVNRGGAT